MFKKRVQKKSPSRNRSPRLENTPNKVFSYYSMQRPTEIEEGERTSARKNRGEVTAKNSRHILLKRIGLFGIFVGIVGLILYNGRIVPSDVQVVFKGKPEQRLLLQDASVYKLATEQLMQQKLQNRTKFTFDTTSFSHSLTQRYPEIAQAQVSLPLFGNVPTVYIQPSSTALIFVAKDKRSYLVNTEGYVIAGNNGKAASTTPVVIDQSGIQPKVGSQALPYNDIRSIQLIVGELRDKKIAINSLVLPLAAQRLEVHLAGKSYYVKFSLHEKVQQQIGAYVAVQRKLDREGTKPKEYVDVRVADRVYYR